MTCMWLVTFANLTPKLGRIVVIWTLAEAGSSKRRCLLWLLSNRGRSSLRLSRASLAAKHKPFFDWLVSRLRAIGDRNYHVSWRLFNTSHYGIPQHRERVYIVRIRKDVATKRRWPTQLADTRPLKDLLEPLRECPRVAEKRFLQTCSA